MDRGRALFPLWRDREDLIASNDQPRPLVVLVGSDGVRQALVRHVFAAKGWRIYQQREPWPLINLSLWTDASLVVLVSEHEAHTLPLLEVLRHVGYEGPFVLLARQPSTDVRRHAFRQGARDVIGLPTDARHIEARLHAVVYTQTYDMQSAAPTHTA